MQPSQPDALYKFGHLTPEDRPWTFGDTWALARAGDTERLTIAPSANQIGIVARLTELMQDPMWLLYVLVVPRGGGDAGRYQSSEPQSRAQMTRFLKDFANFLESDGRHTFWIRSVADGSMLVYDRHNLIYAYGHLEEWKLLLPEIGMKEVESKDIALPVPHSHHYHQFFDAEERRLLSYLPWHWTPLHEQDER